MKAYAIVAVHNNGAVKDVVDGRIAIFTTYGEASRFFQKLDLGDLPDLKIIKVEVLAE